MTAIQLRVQQLCVDFPGVAHFAAITPGSRQEQQKFALTDLDLTVNRGEQIAVIGPSGAGKTTLLHALAAAHKPLRGEHEFMGEQVWQLSHTARHALRRHLFLAPQTPPLPARQRVVTAVLAGRLPQWTLPQAIRNLVKPGNPLAAWQALQKFDLQHKLYARVDKLSGGERQRCGLARLLLSDASLLLVDEPLSALDPTLALQTLHSLQQEASQRQATLICSLHQVELARQHFPRIIGLRAGRIMFDSDKVSDQMIEELYRSVEGQNQDRTELMPPEQLDLSDAPRCF
ncbi:ATP-binding cassette domain-containing protein [Undibacterium sp. TS12]|uniref:phosphonate ABC transporter ATP-binding protein n=1 Tax=Undibacterium sp. TS12 TaxID=2908202 RepID=UPI001F4C76F7|nr:ATP-binding cassette domain-containing protein [Undibacterium sp. TS12]MCH8619915.1 ATP-binding cassette domain-containing protein [Undibacterium sp. TS12]